MSRLLCQEGKEASTWITYDAWNHLADLRRSNIGWPKIVSMAEARLKPTSGQLQALKHMLVKRSLGWVTLDDLMRGPSANSADYFYWAEDPRRLPKLKAYLALSGDYREPPVQI